MSLRLHKAIGYALTDLVPDDPRINPDSPLLNWSQLEEDDETRLESAPASPLQVLGLSRGGIRLSPASAS